MILKPRYVGRFRDVGGVLARHGFSDLLLSFGLARFLPGKEPPPAGSEEREQLRAANLRAALEQLGAAYIKLGQLLSTRPDMPGARVSRDRRGRLPQRRPDPARDDAARQDAAEPRGHLPPARPRARPGLDHARDGRRACCGASSGAWRHATALSAALEARSALTQIPMSLRRVLALLASNELRLGLRLEGAEEMQAGIQKIASRVSLGLITAALIVGSALLLHIEGGPRLWGYPAFGLVGFLLAAGLGVWLLFQIVLRDKH